MPISPSLEQLLRVPHVDSSYGFDISPDGMRMAFSWNASGTWEIYEIAAHGLASIPAAPNPHLRQLTTPPGGKFRPRYSPDGARLAFALDNDGSESFHIAVFDSSTGHSTDLTPGIAFSHQPNISWSPDGRELAVLSDAAGQFGLYLLPAHGGSPQPLLHLDHPCWDAHWSPRGNWIAVEVEWHGQDRSLFLVNVHDRTSFPLQQGGRVLNAMHPSWSPDGSKLAFCADPRGWYQVAFYDLCSEEIHWLDLNQADDTNPAWSPDGGSLAFIRTRGADTSLRTYDIDNAHACSFRLGPGIYSHPRFSTDACSLFFMFESPRQPADLWELNLASGHFTQRTRSLPDDIDTSQFVIPEEVWYPSVDGVQVPAMFYRPHAALAPGLVNIHGGPNWLYQCNWHPLMSYLASQGWAVLAPNYRGSTGYGRAWAQANRMRLGEVDTFDCAAGAQSLLREQLVDPQRLFVSGRSHGGYLTMTCLTEYPELWAGGSAVVPFMNWFTAHQNSREDLQHWDIENFGDPVENAALWRRRSPYFYLDQVRASVQFICGENDPRCPASESIAARDRLLELGKHVELLLYAGEGHGFLQMDNVVDHETRRLGFLERIAASIGTPTA